MMAGMAGEEVNPTPAHDAATGRHLTRYDDPVNRPRPRHQPLTLLRCLAHAWRRAGLPVGVCLQCVQLRIDAILPQQFCVASDFCQPAFVENKDEVRAAHGGEAV